MEPTLRTWREKADDRFARLSLDEGFSTEALMWEKLYVAEGVSLSALSQRFSCSPQMIRSRLLACGLPVRPRGEPAHADIAISDVELSLILSEGIAAAARRLCLPYTVLYHRVRAARRRRRESARGKSEKA